MNYLIPIIAVFGFYNISSKINNKLNIKIDNFFFSIIFFLIFLGLITLLIIFRINLNLAPNFLLIIFLISFLNFIYLYFFRIKSFLEQEKTISILLASFSILTLIPIAGADSYAYHLAWPQDLIHNQDIVFDKLFLESRVVGVGEIVNYVGLLLGSENLLSFLSMVTLFTYILKNKKNKKKIIILILLSSPIYYKYLLDQKPFILPCIFLVIFLENFFSQIELKKINYFDIFSFLISLSFFANTKYPFLLIAFFIYLFFLYIAFKRKFFTKYFLISIFIFIFHFMPLPMTKLFIFGDPFSPFFEGIFNNADQDILKLREMYKSWDGFNIPITGGYYEGIIPFLRNVLNFFIPIAPFTVLDTFGATVVFIFFARYKFRLKFYFALLIFLIIFFLVMFTNFQSRWFLFIFLYVLLSYDYIKLKEKYLSICQKLLFVSALTLSGFHVYYLLNLTNNFINSGFESALIKHVYLYKEFKDVKNISKNSYILTNTRGNYFYKNLIQYKYPNFTKKYLTKDRYAKKIEYGFFSTGTNKIDESKLLTNTLLNDFKPDCIQVIFNEYNLVAKRNTFSRKDYEHFVFVKFKKPILDCIN